MSEYTVVGLWIEDDPPCRVAAWVEADDPESAIEKVQTDGVDGFVGEFLVAGVFAGHLTAVDQQ